jgi:putative ABC transport system permease protein
MIDEKFRPPKLSCWFLSRTPVQEDREGLAGDAEEIFQEIAKMRGVFRARLWVWGQVIMSVPSFISYTTYWKCIMLKNYLIIAIRNFFKHKGFSFINIFGLSIGMMCSILILLYIWDEFSYDHFQKNADRIYRVTNKTQRKDDVRFSARSPVPLGPALKNDFPEIVHSIRFWRAFQPIFRTKDKGFNEEGIYFTDTSVFQVFSFPIISGDVATALAAPNTVVLTQSYAKKYFGNTDCLGQVLSYNGYPAGQLELQVTGIIQDLPKNSNFKFNMLVSLEGVKTEQDNWGSFKPIWTYVLLPENYPPRYLENKFKGFIERHFSDNYPVQHLYLEPLLDAHLHSQFIGGFQSRGSIEKIYLFSAIGLFILLIACINYMNLTTARSLNRVREIGMRRVLGAHRAQLIRQFIIEAILMSFIAVIAAIFLIELFLPLLNAFSEKSLSLGLLNDKMPLLFLVGLTILVGILAGSYPAFFLSRSKRMENLKTRLRHGKESATTQKGLVVFQFAISIVLIIGTFVIYRQLQYVRNRPLGFNKDQIVVLPYSENAKPLITELKRNPNVLNAAISQRVPVNNINRDGRIVKIEGHDEQIQVDSYIVDDEFLDTYDIRLIAGKKFSREFFGDRSGMIINETAVKKFGWNSPYEALGKRIEWSGSIAGRIIGVVQDFHLTSLHEPINPLVMLRLSEKPWWCTFISVRIKPNNLSETLGFIEKSWRQFAPGGIYDYFFIDDSFEQLHHADIRFAKIFTSFAAIAIIIACLGLFGLAAFTSEQRTKEIGVRKVLGASVSGIVTLLSRDFLVLVFIANIIAVPIAWCAMNRWLQNFSYRVSMEWWIFAIAGGMALVIALLTVSTQAIKAATTNPVNALRYE